MICQPQELINIRFGRLQSWRSDCGAAEERRRASADAGRRGPVRAVVHRQGDWVVMVMEPTAAQQWTLDRNPGLARSPHLIIEAPNIAALPEGPSQ